MKRRTPRSTLFPYTTLFRSVDKARKTAYAEYQTALREERALEQEMRGLKSEALDESSASAEYRNLTLEADTRRKDRKSTRLNSSHSQISYAVICLKKKINVT